MKTTATAAVLAAVAALVSPAQAFELCNGVEDQLGVSSFDARVAGSELVLSVSAAKCAGRSVFAHVDVKLLGIPVVSEDLMADGAAMRGSKEIEIVVPLPSELTEAASSSPLDVEVQLWRGEGVAREERACVTDRVTNGASGAETRLGDHVLSTKRFGLGQSTVNWLFSQWRRHFEHLAPVEVAEHELEHRLSVFRDNLLRIFFHNQSGKHTWTMAMNQFGHMTSDEFADMMLGGFKQNDQISAAGLLAFGGERNEFRYDGSELPDEVDWVSKGAVTPIKNQGACGSCWSFATTGALEGAYFLKYGKLVSFSEEQLVTCDHVDMGCNGGLMDNAFAWIERNGGLCTESEEPYVSGSGRMPRCQRCEVVPNSKPSSYHDVAHDEKSLMQAVVQQPVAVAIEADQIAFQFYGGGVLTGSCGTRLDHGVLVVGYGTYKGTEYWKVKNSWGATWGASGYIRIERGKHQNGGECGILESASFPTL